MTDATQNPPTEANAMKRGVDWVAKHWPRVRLGHEGFMLDKIMRQQQFVEADARNVMTGKHDDTTGLPDGDDPMGVKIGDEIHNHFPPPQEKSLAKKHASTLAKAAMIAGLLGGPVVGAAVGVGVPWLLGAFDKPAVVDTDTDTDTQYELRIGPPETPAQP